MKFKRGDRVRGKLPDTWRKDKFSFDWEDRYGTIGATWKPDRGAPLGINPDVDVIWDPIDDEERDLLKDDPHALTTRQSPDWLEHANGVEVMLSIL